MNVSLRSWYWIVFLFVCTAAYSACRSTGASSVPTPDETRESQAASSTATLETSNSFTTDFWVTDGTVFTVAYDDDNVYIGGTFDYVGPSTGGAGGLSAQSGEATQAWPAVQGSVSVTISDGAGGWYIGGKFSIGKPPDAVSDQRSVDSSWHRTVGRRNHSHSVVHDPFPQPRKRLGPAARAAGDPEIKDRLRGVNDFERWPCQGLGASKTPWSADPQQWMTPPLSPQV